MYAIKVTQETSVSSIFAMGTTAQILWCVQVLVIVLRQTVAFVSKITMALLAAFPSAMGFFPIKVRCAMEGVLARE